MTESNKLSNNSIRAAGATALVVLGLILQAATAGAATYTVDNGGDSGAGGSTCTVSPNDCSLRQAIIKANGDGAPDAIDFVSGLTTITLTAPLDGITNSVAIDGGGVVRVVGDANFAINCLPGYYAFDTSAAAVQILGLAIYNVCGRAIYSTTPTPTIQVGPRRADNTVPISGSAVDGSVEIFRADSPAASGEGLSRFKTGLTASGGGYAWVPPSTPATSEKFSSIVSSSGGRTSTFSAPASAPADLTSPTLQRAVAISNNTVRLDFSEPISSAVAGMTGAFALTVGGANREVTNVGVDGSSVYVVSVTTPWNTGDAGSVSLTGSGRVIDTTGNEIIGNPATTVYAGPGELTSPTIVKLKASPTKFCQRATRKCTKRQQTYLYFNVNKRSRVVFTVRRAKGAKFVVQYVHYYDPGTVKSKVTGTMNGRRLPATNMTVEVVAQDNARNFSAPVKANFKVVTRNKSL